MNKEYRYFYWCANYEGKNNTESLNKLISDGWFPEREVIPRVGESQSSRILIFLSKIKEDKNGQMVP